MKRFTALMIKTVMVVFLVASFVGVQPIVSLASLMGTKAPVDRSQIELLVKYRPGCDASTLKAAVKSRLGLSRLDTVQSSARHRMEVLRVNAGTLTALMQDLRNSPLIEYVQPNYKLSASATPTDPRFGEQWALLNNGQEVEGVAGRTGVDINVRNAWDLTMGSASLLVGILDTGIDTSHPDLAGNVFINAGEVPSDGIDNDGNGYVDDVSGWDFANGDDHVFDSATSDTHGTQVAGIVAATANSDGITGVAPGVKLVPLKFISNGAGYTSDAIAAIDYAMAMGVQIINCSFSGYDDNPALKDAMANSGILFVTAAGNRGGDISQYPVYPAGFDLTNQISVASVDSIGRLSSYTTFGPTVDVAAPGDNILSTVPDASYGYLTGTSGSAALVTGVIALGRSYLPQLELAEIAQEVRDHVVVCAALQGKIGTAGRVDAYATLTNTVPQPDEFVPPPSDGQQPLDPGDLSSWFPADQLAKIKETLHYGESGVNPATGNYSVTVNDISIPAPGFQVNISRAYNSRNEKTGPLGRGWTFGFEGSVAGTDMVTVNLPNGSIQMFRLSGGTYVPLDSRNMFVRNADGTCVLTTKDQYSYGFNADGRLAWMKDRNTNAVTITYDFNGRIGTITDTVGRQYAVLHNAQGHIYQITGPDNIIVTYAYDANGMLQTVTDAEGGLMKYYYDSFSFLNRIEDHYGNRLVEMTYSHASGPSLNKVTQATDALGYPSTYSYQTDTTSVLEGGSRRWDYWFDASKYTIRVQDPQGRSTLTEYHLLNGQNLYGDVKSTTDRNGNKTSYEIDARGNVIKITNPDLSYKQFWYDEKNNLIKEIDESGCAKFYVYDANKLNLLKQVQPLIKGAEYVDGSGNPTDFAITEYAYFTRTEAQSMFNCNAAGLVKTVKDPTGSITEYTYDQDGNVKTTEDPLGNVTETGHDRAGHLLYTKTPRLYRTDYAHDRNGLLTKQTLHGGETTRTTYDRLGRKTQVVSPNQYDASLEQNGAYTGTTQGYRYTYHSSGKVATVTDPTGNTTSYTYDVFGNKLAEVRPNGSVYGYEYDSLDRVVREYFRDTTTSSVVVLKEYSYAVLSNGRTQETETVYLNDTEKAVTVRVGDYAGRPVEQRNPDGTSVLTVYNPDGKASSMTGPNGSSTYLKYDDLGRLSQQWAPLEISAGTTKYMYSQFEYDKAGRRTVERLGKDKVGLNEVPSTFVTKTRVLDANGNVLSATDNEGRKTEYQYDADGNRIREDVYTGPTDKLTTEYEYAYLKKPTAKKQHVMAGDIYGNDSGDARDLTLTTSYAYDRNGNLLTTTTPDNVATTYGYDGLDRQTSVSMPGLDAGGAAVTITTTTAYDWQGNPVSKTDANGNSTAYAYDKRGFLLSITDALQGVTAFRYDHAGRKTVEVSPINYDAQNTIEQMNRAEFVYDTMGRLKAKVLKFQEKTVNAADLQWTSTWVEYVAKAFKYDASGNVVKELDALGYQAGSGTTIDARVDSGYGTETTYNLANKIVTSRDAETKLRALPYSTRVEYDGLGRKIVQTDAKGVTTGYSYDDAGNVTRVTIRKSLASPEQVTEASTYDLANRHLGRTDGNGNTVTFSYNSFGTQRSGVYPGDATIPANTVSRQYDVMGNLKAQRDTAGTVDLYQHDNQGRVLSHTQQKADGTESITTSVRYDQNGNKRFETDGNGVTTESRYDQLNRLTETRLTVGGVLKATGYTYDANGNQLTSTDWRGNVYTNAYDPLGRVIEKRDPYTTIQRICYNRNDVQVRSYDALNHLTEFRYDRNNRLTATIDPLGHATSQAYDEVGNVQTKTDGNDNATTYSYDELGRLLSVRNAKNEATRYTYDLNGNKLTQSDGNGSITTWEYNVMNLPIRRIAHGGRGGAPGSYSYVSSLIESSTYNANGALSTKTDPNGRTTICAYDAHGRMTSQAIGTDSIAYTYDGNGNQLSMTDSTGVTSRTYDEQNRVLTKVVPDIGTMAFVYDITDGVATGYTGETSTDPKGNITTKVNDKAGRLTQVIADGQTTYSYYGDGKRQSVVYPNGVREEYTYYANGTLESLTNKRGDGSTIDAYSYSYDAAGNQAAKTDAKGTTNYAYDVLNRLLTVTEPDVSRVTAYSYDGAGNRLSESVTNGTITSLTTYCYDRQNRVTSTVTQLNSTTITVAFTHDANGNMLSRVTRSTQPLDQLTEESVSIHLAGVSGNSDVSLFEYDAWNRLVRSKTSSAHAINEYDGDGLRTSKTVNGLTTRYLYDSGRVMLELDGAGNEKARNLHGLNVLARRVAGVTAFYLYNGHADVTSLADATGSVLAAYYYDAFGNPTEETGAADNPFRYAGYRFDAETDLYYLNARYYDSKLARFLSEDTYTGSAGDPMSLNLYSYCSNDPIRYIDPTGHILTEWDKDNLSIDEQCAIEQLTTLWEEANAEGNAAGMAGAHMMAEAIREQYRSQDGLIGSASGFTYVVDAGIAEMYQDDWTQLASGDSSEYIPTHSAPAIDIQRENLASMSPATLSLLDTSDPVRPTKSSTEWEQVNRNQYIAPRPMLIPAIAAAGAILWTAFLAIAKVIPPDMLVKYGEVLNRYGELVFGAFSELVDKVSERIPGQVVAAGDEAFARCVPQEYMDQTVVAFKDRYAVAIKLTKPITVYRYTGPNQKVLGSPWFSPITYPSAERARSRLALPDRNTAEILSVFEIPAGTEILVGVAEDMRDQEDYGPYAVGGGVQFYVNPEEAILIRSEAINRAR